MVAALLIPGAEAGTPYTPETVRSRRLRPLHEFEEQRRREADFRAAPGGDTVTGPDPYLVRALPGAGGFVTILRGASELLLLDADMKVAARTPTLRAPTGLVVTDGGDIFVSSELVPAIVRYRATPSGVQRTGAVTLGDVRAVRDLAFGAPGVLYGVDEAGGRLVTLRLGATRADGEIAVARSDLPIGRGPVGVTRVGPLLLVNCLLDHAVVVWRVGSDGRPLEPVGRVQHDGPIWSFDAVIANDAAEALLVVGGVEDHPLDRTGGSFGYIDSFVSVYRLSWDRLSRRGASQFTRVAEINLSRIGVVTPKVVSASRDPGGGLRVLVTGYGTSLLATLVWPESIAGDPKVAVEELAPGTTSLARRADGALVFADPLLDAWVVRADGQTRIVPVLDGSAGALASRRDSLSRVGEALLFTTLMAPWNRTEGPLSRFTCETCHFEMYVDGRTHHTGRGDVRATTKPLRGLFNNRPHFSRALDPDLATVADNEFRVAGAKSDHDPWFSVRVADFPWLRALGVAGGSLSPLTLRKALMTSLMELGHMPNPAVTPGARWTDDQGAGAELFRDRCEACHQARLVSDDPATRAPFARWQELVMTEADPLVWGQSEYRQTGVVPYVHDQGARVPSLRRLYKKAPYFTNGSAKDLGSVLGRARFSEQAFFHDGAPSGVALDRLEPAAVRRLQAFLDLL